ncbi:MAG: carboxypeptidase-like regulatory domain-containing protein, partial [Pyrinomonadaceae bacterium]
VLAAFCLLPSAYAQTGGLKGKVKNMEGDGIGGAEVTARLNGKDIRTVTANSRGDFILEPLDAGLYNLVFDAKGYAAAVKHNVEVKAGKTKDLGGGLILMVDRGMQVIIEGSVYYKNGTSLAGAEVKIERVNPDGSTSKVRTMYASESGEVVLRQGEGKAKFRFTATHKGVTGSKEIEVDGAARYRFSIILDVERERKPSNL